MKVASVTVMAMAQGLARGRQVSWNEAVAAAARVTPTGLEISVLRGVTGCGSVQGNALNRVTDVDGNGIGGDRFHGRASFWLEGWRE
jgi:hypothetical protein